MATTTSSSSSTLSKPVLAKDLRVHDNIHPMRLCGVPITLIREKVTLELVLNDLIFHNVVTKDFITTIERLRYKNVVDIVGNLNLLLFNHCFNMRQGLKTPPSATIMMKEDELGCIQAVHRRVTQEIQAEIQAFVWGSVAHNDPMIANFISLNAQALFREWVTRKPHPAPVLDDIADPSDICFGIEVLDNEQKLRFCRELAILCDVDLPHDFNVVLDNDPTPPLHSIMSYACDHDPRVYKFKPIPDGDMSCNADVITELLKDTSDVSTDPADLKCGVPVEIKKIMWTCNGIPTYIVRSYSLDESGEVFFSEFEIPIVTKLVRC